MYAKTKLNAEKIRPITKQIIEKFISDEIGFCFEATFPMNAKRATIAPPFKRNVTFNASRPIFIRDLYVSNE